MFPFYVKMQALKIPSLIAPGHSNILFIFNYKCKIWHYLCLIYVQNIYGIARWVADYAATKPKPT